MINAISISRPDTGCSPRTRCSIIEMCSKRDLASFSHAAKNRGIPKGGSPINLLTEASSIEVASRTTAQQRPQYAVLFEPLRDRGNRLVLQFTHEPTVLVQPPVIHIL